MKFLLILLFVACAALCVNGQDKYVFRADPQIQVPKIEECPSNQYLSEDVRIKLAQFNQVYSKKINMGAPDFQTSIEILKPDVYYSVQKLSKYFCKCMKKGTIGKENAEDEFRKILEKCIQIVQEDTSPLEAELRATSNPVELVGIFDKIVIKN